MGIRIEIFVACSELTCMCTLSLANGTKEEKKQKKELRNVSATNAHNPSSIPTTVL